MLGFGSLLGTGWGGRLCLLWLPGKRRLFIALQRSVTNLTSTDQKSSMACYFAVFLLTSLSAPDAHRGQVNLLDWLKWTFLTGSSGFTPKEPTHPLAVNVLSFLCLTLYIAFGWWYFISWTFCDYTASSKKKMCKLKLICFKTDQWFL